MKTLTTVAVLVVAVLIVAGCNDFEEGRSTTGTGFLTVTVGFAAQSTTKCTGTTTVDISGPGGLKSFPRLVFSGTGSQVDPNHFGCAVTALFPRLTPGNWTATATTDRACSKHVTAGKSTTILIWEHVCS